MSDTYCGLLNVLILSILAGAQGLVLRRQSEVKDELRTRRGQSRAEDQ